MITTPKKFSIILSFIVLIILALIIKGNWTHEAKKSTVIINKVAISVDVADTDARRGLGLSGRGELRDNEGMLFIFDPETTPGFWMKDMNFPIDIIWLDTFMNTVFITKNAEPSSYPSIFTPPVLIKYVLEVPAGFADKNNVKNGDQASFVD